MLDDDDDDWGDGDPLRSADPPATWPPAGAPPSKKCFSNAKHRFCALFRVFLGRMDGTPLYVCQTLHICVCSALYQNVARGKTAEA